MGIGPPNMSSVVQSFSTPGTRRRFGVFTTNAEGFRVPGAPVDTVTQGHLFPATGDLLGRFELQDVAGLYEVHTATELRTMDPATQVPADYWIAAVRGVSRTFEVLASGPWLEGAAGANTWTVAALQEVVPA